uniref:Protein split ends n=1 Tax=Cacopsylla melanoneura TaxID=428564 RepID=A0A8D8Q9J7_9HEMI
MVRETRHLWVGNLPDNIREEDIVEHFKRYGRVQSVKVVSRGALDGMSGGGACATVSFMDIKSASKAHNIDQKFEECALTTEYHEPAAIPREPPPNPASVPAPLIPLTPLTPSNPAHYGSPRYNHGSSTEDAPFDRSSHFYAEGESSYARRSSSYHSSSSSSDSNIRGRPRDRLYSRNGPSYPIIESVVTRTPGTTSSTGGTLHSRGGWSYEGTGRYTPPDHPSLISPRRGDSAPTITTATTPTTTTVSVAIHRKKHSKSRSGSNGSESGGSNSISSSRSRSRSNSSSSRSSSTSSPHSSPSSSKTCSTHRSRSTLQSAVSTSSPGLHSEDRRALAICVRNLPARSSDTSLKDGLYHEYKKHGKVSWVKIIGQGIERYGLVCFKKADDAEKAVIQSHEKQFFGCKIEVAPYHDVDLDFEFRNESCCRPYEAELDEFHPKATRTLFIGNLEKDITASELQKHFDQFGQIIFVDIKKQSSSSAFAFVQYTDISSVVRAMRAMDGEYVGNNRVNLGYGKSLATTCVWVDGIADNVSDKYLSVQFSQYGAVSHVEIDRSRGQALVFYQQVMMAQAAVNGMRGVMMRGRKLQVDFASRECQDAFYESQKSSSIFENSIGASPASSASGGGGPPIVRGGLDTPSSSSSSTSSSRNYRHSTSRPSPIYSRAPSPTPLSLTPKRLSSSSLIRCDYTNEYVMDRRPPYRSFEDAVIEEKMVVVIQQAPSEMRHQKERMSLDEMSSMEEAQEHRRKCKHRRSHSGENSRPGTPLCDERPDYAINSKHDPTTPFPLFSNPLSSLSKPPPSPPPSTPSPPYVPPPRPPSSSSEDSEPASCTQLTDWELRLKSLDEKYEKWSGNRNVTGTNKMEKPVRHKLLEMNVHELQPSDIVKSVLAKRSIFDEDSKRLENMNEKYEPKEYIPSRIGIQNFRSYLTPATSPSPCPVKPVPVNKGLQYPFPSHPHVVNNCQPPRREPVTVNHTLIEPHTNTISKPTVPIPNNIRRNSTNSTLGDTARRRSREETVEIPQLSETKNVNETRIKLEFKPLSETSTNTTSSNNKDFKAIPPGEDIKPDIKPSVEENPSVVDNKLTVAVPPVETKPSAEIVPKSEPTPTTVALVIKHELPTTTSTEEKVTPFPIKCNEIAPVERRRSIEEPKQKEVKESVEDKTIECNKTRNHVNVNPVLTTASPLVTPTPSPTPKPKDCDVNKTVVDNKRDTERDRRKSKELIDHNNSSSTSTVPTSIEITSTSTKSRLTECSDKVEIKEKREVKHNCVDIHSKHKDKRESEKEKRKEKENVEIKSNSQRKEHENHKIQISDRRTSKEDNEEKDKKKNNEHSSSKQHKTRDTDSEHSSSRHHNNIPRKDKHKSSSSRHKESEKKSYDHDKKDNHDENKRKDNHEESKRKENHDEVKRKDSHDEIKRKDSHEENRRKESNEENKRKETHDEVKRKDNQDEIKRKDSPDEIKRKDSHDEIKRKDSVAILLQLSRFFG